jgi:diaminopimelate decarboxylase
MRENKFGIDIRESLKLYRKARGLDNLEVRGVDCHIGSQLTRVQPFVDALTIIVDFVKKLRRQGINVEFIDFGGGLGITYRDEAPPHPIEYASAVASIARGLDITLILEPGRVLTGNSGALVTELLYRKETREKTFYIVDAAMNDLFRPSLYGSYHEIITVKKGRGKLREVDVVGPICESGDFLARDREMPLLRRGELMAVMSSGAYGFSMASNYNSRPRIPEVLVAGDSFHLIRERESLKDLVRGERIPPFLRKKW